MYGGEKYSLFKLVLGKPDSYRQKNEIETFSLVQFSCSVISDSL